MNSIVNFGQKWSHFFRALAQRQKCMPKFFITFVAILKTMKKIQTALLLYQQTVSIEKKIVTITDKCLYVILTLKTSSKKFEKFNKVQ